MHAQLIVRLGVLVASPLAAVSLLAAPASAVSQAGVVTVSSTGGSGKVTGNCVFVASLPQTGSINDIPIVYTGTATSTGSGTVVPVSTSIRCWLDQGGTGANGLTAPGAVAATAGKGSYYRLAPAPRICAMVSAAFSDGNVALPQITCHNL